MRRPSDKEGDFAGGEGGRGGVPGGDNEQGVINGGGYCPSCHPTSKMHCIVDGGRGGGTGSDWGEGLGAGKEEKGTGRKYRTS